MVDNVEEQQRLSIFINDNAVNFLNYITTSRNISVTEAVRRALAIYKMANDDLSDSIVLKERIIELQEELDAAKRWQARRIVALAEDPYVAEWMRQSEGADRLLALADTPDFAHLKQKMLAAYRGE